jgi:hypothetical protein
MACDLSLNPALRRLFLVLNIGTTTQFSTCGMLLVHTTTSEQATRAGVLLAHCYVNTHIYNTYAMVSASCKGPRPWNVLAHTTTMNTHMITKDSRVCAMQHQLGKTYGPGRAPHRAMM